MTKTAKDLTSGKPSTVLWNFSLPLLGSIIFQQLYNIADSFVAGKFIGDNALAAVGNGYEVTLIYLAFAFGCNIGCSVVLSQLFGAKRYKDLKTAVNTNFIASGVLCILLMAVGFIFMKPLLHAINTPADIMDDTMLYLNIYTGGLLFLFYYNISTGIFSALGDSKTPFVFLALSSTANIGADILFVTTFDMGIAGVAWATFICQGVSCILSVIVVFAKLRKIKCEKPDLFSVPLFKKIARIAIPSILQQGFVSVGNIIIQSIVNSFGTSVIAGYAAAVKVNNFAITCFNTLGNAMSNYCAQNMGAGKKDRIKQGFKSGIIMCSSFALIFSAVFLLLRKQLIGLFMNSGTTDALTVGVTFLLIVSPFFIVIAAKLTADGLLRGAGAMKYFMITTFTDLVLRVSLAFILSKFFDSTGIWLAWPIGWTIASVLSLTFYGKGVWKKYRI
ncbi:MAG: MATE family efflux transporter [Eubacterium sp.]|nr:MATE family efflux transporter [Eubacterium sp.]MDE6155527.1 MATE family efflux transporter [Eubacterium sp.]